MNENTALPIVISGPSGCGKDTVVTELRKMDSSVALAISATTRTPRGNEQDGVDYYFLEKDEFEEKIENDEFIEFVQYNGNYYGTLKSEVSRLAQEGKKCVLVIEVKGAANIIAKYPDCLSVFLMPPSVDELENRLRGRGTESEESIAGRLKIARDEMERRSQYKFVVVNDVLEDAVKQIYDIINNR